MNRDCTLSGITAAGYRKILAIPRCRASLGLRVGERALIEKLHKIFGEKNIQRPIDRHSHFGTQTIRF